MGDNIKKKISLILVLVMLITLPGCTGATSGAGENTVGEITVDDLAYDENENIWYSKKEGYEPLINLMKKECEEEGAMGTYLLANDEDIIFIGGIDALQTDGKKVNAYTTYEIGSVTKAVTAAAVLKLCEEGKISLDDKVTKYFPEYDKAENITIYHLLHMQSGIIREFLPEETLYKDAEVRKKYYTDGYSDEELLSGLYDQNLLFNPGTKSEYSNTNYNLLAMIIEKVTGASYADYIDETIFEPCGMTHSSSMAFGDVTAVPKEVSEGVYSFDVKELVTDGYVNTPNTWRGAGDIHSCVVDMLAFDRALYGGKIINEDSLSEMFNMDKEYGCGWMSSPYLENVYYHSGGTPCFSAANAIYKDTAYGNLYFISLKPTVENIKVDSKIMENLNTVLKLSRN